MHLWRNLIKDVQGLDTAHNRTSLREVTEDVNKRRDITWPWVRRQSQPNSQQPFVETA